MTGPGDAPESALQWACEVLGEGARITGAKALRPTGSPWLLEVARPACAEEYILKAHGLDWLPEISTEAAALGVAEAHGLPAPRLVAADLHGADAGLLALLLSVVPGDTAVPMHPTEDRLRAAGALAAAIHRIPLEAGPGLPERTRHMDWMDYTAERSRGNDHPAPGDESSMPLLAQAATAVASITPTSGPRGLVHGDLWQGNLVWQGDECVGIIDWEAAGSGHHGVDVGALRLDVALMHDLDAPRYVLAGWEATSGTEAEDVPYWDLVAALNTPADMTPVGPSMAQVGRPDLDGLTLTARRNDFVRSALATMNNSG